jgi:hypothetical protein
MNKGSVEQIHFMATAVKEAQKAYERGEAQD